MAIAPWRDDAEPSKQMPLTMSVRALARDALRDRHRKLVRRGRRLHKLDAPQRHLARIAAKPARQAPGPPILLIRRPERAEVACPGGRAVQSCFKEIQACLPDSPSEIRRHVRARRMHADS
ncbi:hypothetical protein AB4061_29800 [Cupriavidus sp. YAF13]